MNTPSNTKPIKINTPRRSLADITKQQNQERGIEPLPLEPELLLKRITDGGHSGQYLADAFLSMYRTDKPFPHSLGGLTKLDAEAFRLFHGILHVRFNKGWNDAHLYQIEQQINAIVGALTPAAQRRGLNIFDPDKANKPAVKS